jgi:hypothetical protein
MVNWQDRIIGFSRVPASDFLANPSNPRRHPIRQREALRGSLDTLGWVAPVLVNKRTNFLLDGHARIEEALSKDENALIPVIEVDLEEHEEKLFLASFDYITYMGEYDRDSLDSLLQDVQTDDVRLQAMLNELAVSHGIIDKFDPMSEWVGMPEFEQGEIKAFHTIKVYFQDENAIEVFARLMNQTVTSDSTSIHFPAKEKREIGAYRLNES